MDMIVQTSVSVKSSKTELCLSFEEDPIEWKTSDGRRDGIVATDDANVSRDKHFEHKTRTGDEGTIRY